MTVQGACAITSQMKRNMQDLDKRDTRNFYSSLMNIQQAYAEDSSIYDNVSGFPAIILHEPIQATLTPEQIQSLGIGATYTHLTGFPTKDILMFYARCIGFSDRPSPDDCLEIPKTFDEFDPESRHLIMNHQLYYWMGAGALPQLSVGDIVLVQFDDMANLENGYAVKVIESQGDPGGGMGLGFAGGGAYDPIGAFGAGAPPGAGLIDVMAAGDEGPVLQSPTAAQYAKAKQRADQLCEWIGPYNLVGGDRETIFHAVIINNILVEKALGPYTIIMLEAATRDGVDFLGDYNSGFRPTWAGDIGPKDSFRSPVGQITADDIASNVVDKPCADWDGTTPPTKPKKANSSQERLYWRMCYGPKSGAPHMSPLGLTPVDNKGVGEGWGNKYGCKPACCKPKMKVAAGHQDGTAIDMNAGAGPDKRYKWMIENGWKYGFRRTVGSERWHWEYQPGKTMFGRVSKTNELWDNYFTEANLAAVTVVPADSPVTKQEDVGDI